MEKYYFLIIVILLLIGVVLLVYEMKFPKDRSGETYFSTPVYYIRLAAWIIFCIIFLAYLW